MLQNNAGNIDEIHKLIDKSILKVLVGISHKNKLFFGEVR